MEGAELVVRMTSKDIGQRFHSVDDVLTALEQWDAPDQMAATQASGAPIAMMQAQIQQPQSVAFVPQPGFSTPTTGAQHHATPQSGAPYGGHPSQPMQQAPPTGPMYSAAPQPTEMGQRPMVVIL